MASYLPKESQAVFLHGKNVTAYYQVPEISMHSHLEGEYEFIQPLWQSITVLFSILSHYPFLHISLWKLLLGQDQLWQIKAIYYPRRLRSSYYLLPCSHSVREHSRAHLRHRLWADGFKGCFCWDSPGELRYLFPLNNFTFFPILVYVVHKSQKVMKYENKSSDVHIILQWVNTTTKMNSPA